ncbi:MAG TPA: glycine cleavage system protein H, partial [Anaeromyxobacteraceae bacterium]|nr:glycine cleavage system protein H [Anaeromyxobacteraceae bacterium]
VGFVLGVMVALVVAALILLGGARLARMAVLWAQGYRTAGGLRYRAGLSYAPGHTWLRADGSRLRIGLDDLAQRLFPWTVAVELPARGQKVREGEPVARISAGGQEARVAAPVSGTIVAVNAAVARDPALVKSDGYGKGWLFAVEPDDRGWSKLPSGEAARGWLRGEGYRLTRFYEQQLGYAAADGGALLGPPSSLLGPEQWKALVRAFLGT